jgi:hypothetical protein
MLSAKPWKAMWDELVVGWEEGRKMIVLAPGLPTGRPATIQVLMDGTHVVGMLEGVSSSDELSVPWKDWFFEEHAEYAGEMPAGAVFPEVSFHFVVECGSRRVACRVPCVYADALVAVIKDEDERVLASREYLLMTHYGCRSGSTDENGLLLEQNLPPGGSRVLLDGHNCLDFLRVDTAESGT